MAKLKKQTPKSKPTKTDYLITGIKDVFKKHGTGRVIEVFHNNFMDSLPSKYSMEYYNICALQDGDSEFKKMQSYFNSANWLKDILKHVETGKERYELPGGNFPFIDLQRVIGILIDGRLKRYPDNEEYQEILCLIDLHKVFSKLHNWNEE